MQSPEMYSLVFFYKGLNVLSVMQRIYLDSNVFISLIDREIGRQVRGLFIEVELFLEQLKKEGHVLVLSEWFFKEVKQACYLDKGEILAYFEKTGIKTEVVEQKEKLSLKEFTNKGLHFPDSLHAAIALKHECDCIVTFNLKDFEKIKDEIEVVEPSAFV